MSLYRFHYLYEGLDKTEESEKAPRWFLLLYLIVFGHELCLYLILMLAMTCMACAAAAISYEYYQRRIRRRQIEGFPEYREEEFNGPDIARADSINKRVSHLEQIKKAAKT